MPQPKLSIYTQTPYVRFLRDDIPDGTPLSSLEEGVDHLPSPGGVTRMMRTLVAHPDAQRRVERVTWVSLSNGRPTRVRLSPRVLLETVQLEADAQAEYARAKGALWDAVHGLGEPVEEDALAPLAHLSHAMAHRATATTPDVHYVHDFQLLPLARHLPDKRPRVFHWHIPVAGLEGSTRRYVRDHLNDHDAVIVSTRGYARALRAAGVRVPVHARYPYIDEPRRVVTRDDVAAFEARYALDHDDVVFALVARMDPMKRQDLAIQALAQLPAHAKLVLVGGGGFSAGRAGLGMDYAARWRERLETLAGELGVADRVIFTGGIPDHELEVAYTRAQAVLLPSTLEGFGLAPVEGWLRGRPAIVSRGCGVAELVEDGRNGYTFPPGDDTALARAMQRLCDDPALVDTLGRVGRVSARACTSAQGAADAWRLLSEHTAPAARRRG